MRQIEAEADGHSEAALATYRTLVAANRRKVEQEARKMRAAGQTPPPPAPDFDPVVFVDAAREQNVKVLRQQIEAMRELDLVELVNVRSKPGGWTALQTAAYQGQLISCQILVESGAKVSLRSPAGYTAIQYAHRKGRDEVEEFLVNAFEIEMKQALARRQQEGDAPRA